MATIRSITAKELQSRLEEFESRFRTPSADMAEAFRNGQMHETAELREWSRLFAAWTLATRT